MQLTLDLSELSKTRVIAILEAFYGANLAKDAPVHKIIGNNPDRVLTDCHQPIANVVSTTGDSVTVQPTDTQDAAAIFGAVAPFAPATVDAAAQQTAPVVSPASSLPTPPAMPLPAAMPAATVSAPAAAAPTAPAPTVDKDGLPWDARIHSSSKALNADGRWRAKKGLNDGAMVAAVQAELRALMAIPVPPPVASYAAGSVDGFQPMAAPVVVAPLATNFVAPTTLPEFMPLVSAAMMAGKLTVDHMNAELAALGVVGGITALMARQDLVPSLWSTLQAKYAL